MCVCVCVCVCLFVVCVCVCSQNILTKVLIGGKCDIGWDYDWDCQDLRYLESDIT